MRTLLRDLVFVSTACLATLTPCSTTWAAGAVDRPRLPVNDQPVAFADEEQAVDPGVTLTLMPSNFNLNRSISFDEHGEPRHRHNQLSINFYCFYESESTPLSYRDLEITSVLTSAGEELEIDPNNQRRHQQNIHANRQRNGRPYFDLYLNLPAPTRQADALAEVRGTVKLELAKGPERRLRLAPVSKYLDKRFRVTDMDDAPMSIRRIAAQNNEPATIEWTYPRAIEPLVQEVKFYRRNGEEFEANRRGGGGDNTSRNQRFAIGGDHDVVMVVHLYRQAQTVEVPFVVRDLPLPAAEPEDPRFDLAVATEPVGQPIEVPDAAGDDIGPAQPDERDLPIMILD